MHREQDRERPGRSQKRRQLIKEKGSHSVVDSGRVPPDLHLHSSSSSSSSSLKAEEERKPPPPAAAFTEIGFEKPFGQPAFQAVWVKHFLEAKSSGGWLTAAMEETIQECQGAKIGMPPQFYDAKHDVEKTENILFAQKQKERPPL